MSLGRSFETHDPVDRIWDVLHLPKTVTSLEVCRADETQIQYFLTIAKCSFSTLPGETFDDLFPREAILNYREDNGNYLPQIQWMGSEPGRAVLRAPRDASGSRMPTASDHHLTHHLYFAGSARNKPGALIVSASNVTGYDYINQSTLYLVLEALPRFAFWLAAAFSICLYYEREQVQKSHAEAQAFVAQIAQGFEVDHASTPNELDPPTADSNLA